MTHFEIYKSDPLPGLIAGRSLLDAVIGGPWRWRLKASNGRIIADSGEGYHNEKDCIDAIFEVMHTDVRTPIVPLPAASHGLLNSAMLGSIPR